MKNILNLIIVLLLTIGNVAAISITDSTAACHGTNGQSLHISGGIIADYCRCGVNKFIITTDFLSWIGCNDSRNSFITEEEFIKDLESKAETAASVSGNMEKKYLDIVSNKIDKNVIQENLQSRNEQKNAYYLIGLIILLLIVYFLYKKMRRSKKNRK